MVLLFDMFLSLLASSDGANFKTLDFRFYSRNELNRFKFSGSLWQE